LRLLRENKDKLIRLAKVLEKKEVLGKEEIERIIGKKVTKEAIHNDESTGADYKG